MIVFLTGATGFLGGELLVTLSKRKEIRKIYCLIRSKSDDEVIRRLKHIFELHKDKFNPEKIVPVVANLTDIDLISKLDSFEDLKNVNLVVHSAANTSFSKSADDLVKLVNINGLETLLNWAKKLKRLETFLYIGTATICGKEIKNRVIYEHESPNQRAHHLVTYTYTKMMGELLLKKHLAGNQVLVVRPSIIMGDCIHEIPRSSVILWTLAAFNYLRLIPVNQYSKIDIISVDYAAEAIASLLFSKRNHNVYHISAGEYSSTDSYSVTNKIENYFNHKPKHCFVERRLSNNMRLWAKSKSDGNCELAPYKEYLNYWENLLGEKARLRILFAGLEPYLDFIELGQIFDNSRLLSDTGISKPVPAHEYITKNIEFLKTIDIYEGAIDP